jgi:MtN3 and saliva related transmembrane protein
MVLNPLNLILFVQSEGNVITLENIFGTTALVTSFIGLIPQIYKAYVTKSSKDISMLMLANYTLCSVAWIGYGLLNGSDFVLSSNIVGLITCVISIGQKLHYDKQIHA